MTGTQPDAGPGAVPGPRPHDRRNSRLRTEPDGAMALPLAGQPGHGRTAFVRRQPVRMVDGRFEYTELEIQIAPDIPTETLTFQQIEGQWKLQRFH